jgi:hypothetical protein
MNLNAEEIVGGIPDAKRGLPHFKICSLKAQFCRGVPGTVNRALIVIQRI